MMTMTKFIPTSYIRCIHDLESSKNEKFSYSAGGDGFIDPTIGGIHDIIESAQLLGLKLWRSNFILK